MIGCVLFTDPLEDGEIIEANGYLPYPGMYMNVLHETISTVRVRY